MTIFKFAPPWTAILHAFDNTRYYVFCGSNNFIGRNYARIYLTDFIILFFMKCAIIFPGCSLRKRATVFVFTN
jgi:hypothetical protein